MPVVSRASSLGGAAGLSEGYLWCGLRALSPRPAWLPDPRSILVPVPASSRSGPRGLRVFSLFKSFRLSHTHGSQVPGSLSQQPRGRDTRIAAAASESEPREGPGFPPQRAGCVGVRLFSLHRGCGFPCQGLSPQLRLGSCSGSGLSLGRWAFPAASSCEAGASLTSSCSILLCFMGPGRADGQWPQPLASPSPCPGG